MELNQKMVWVSDQGNGTYKNPILFGDYSDPDVIRVGKDFYMVASSFNNMPGLPVLHSKDLVNWTVINYAVKNLSFEYYNVPAHGKGIWAPSIRYHDEKFWVFYPTPDEGIFMSSTKDPYGDWSEPVHVKKAKGWIDPCPLWDEDGNAYLVNAFAGSRTGFKSIINIAKMKPDGTELLDEGTYVFDGNKNEHHTIEGPKLYKRNGYYYIFAPAGGVVAGWQTILRSKNIYGPYEDRIVLDQGRTAVNGPHQGALIELESGESWFLHFQDKGAYGRIVHLQPVQWVDDWPVIGIDKDNDGKGEPVDSWKKPNVGGNYPISEPVTSDEFDNHQLGLQWQWNANYKDQWYSFTAQKSCIRMYPDCQSTVNTKLCDLPNLLLQKFPAPRFTAETKLELHAKMDGDSAGLIILGEVYSAIMLEKGPGGFELKQIKGFNYAKQKKESVESVVCSIPLTVNTIYFKVSVGDSAICSLSYCEDGVKYVQFGEKFATTPGIWVGAKMGIFFKNTVNCASQGNVDYDWFRVESK
jgi:beta-xylosidase